LDGLEGYKVSIIDRSVDNVVTFSLLNKIANKKKVSLSEPFAYAIKLTIKHARIFRRDSPLDMAFIDTIIP